MDVLTKSIYQFNSDINRHTIEDLSVLIESIQSCTKVEDLCCALLSNFEQYLLFLSKKGECSEVRQFSLHLYPEGIANNCFDYISNSNKKRKFSRKTNDKIDFTWRLLKQYSAPFIVCFDDGKLTGLPATSVRWPEDGKISGGANYLVILPVFFDRQLSGVVELKLRMSGYLDHTIPKTLIESLQLRLNMATLALQLIPFESPCQNDNERLLPVVGKNMLLSLEIIKTFAIQDETLLIQGASGVGKSRLARWSHSISKRHEEPFEILDLSTIPDDMQLATLFGWRKGSFTGAVNHNRGVIGRAEKGTLFIDEINKLSVKAQAGLLELLETQCYTPLGSDRGHQLANVRFIVGTNADLPKLVDTGVFREDLYYRINVLPITLPPLSERRDEIGLWAQYMVQRRHQELFNNGRCIVHHEAVALLEQQSWRGNLRQLDNIIRRAYAIHLSKVENPLRNTALLKEDFITALAYESPQAKAAVSENVLSSKMWEVSELLVSQTEMKNSMGERFELDYADALKGYVLATALRKFRSKKRTYEFFNRKKALANRTYHREIKREIEKAISFEKEMNSYQEKTWSDLLDNS